MPGDACGELAHQQAPPGIFVYDECRQTSSLLRVWSMTDDPRVWSMTDDPRVWSMTDDPRVWSMTDDLRVGQVKCVSSFL